MSGAIQIDGPKVLNYVKKGIFTRISGAMGQYGGFKKDVAKISKKKRLCHRITGLTIITFKFT